MTRVDVIPEYAFTVSDFISAEECAGYIQLSEQVGYSAAPITTGLGPVMSPGVRNNLRVMIDRPDIAADLWTRAAPLFQRGPGDLPPVGLNERLRFYRYDVGHRFRAHRDGCYRRPGTKQRSLYTMLVYLNDGCTGGETYFLETGDAVRPETGMALFFVHRLLHSGVSVETGRKYVLRTDVMFDLSG